MIKNNVLRQWVLKLVMIVENRQGTFLWWNRNTETEYTYGVFCEKEAMDEWIFKKQNSAVNRAAIRVIFVKTNGLIKAVRYCDNIKGEPVRRFTRLKWIIKLKMNKDYNITSTNGANNNALCVHSTFILTVQSISQNHWIMTSTVESNQKDNLLQTHILASVCSTSPTYNHTTYLIPQVISFPPEYTVSDPN